MDAGINNVIYMELHSGPKMVNGTCGKTIIAGTIDRGSTVHHIVYDGPNAACTYPLCGTSMLPVNNNIQVVYMHLTVTVNSIYMYLRLIVNRIYMHSRLTEQHLHAHDAD